MNGKINIEEFLGISRNPSRPYVAAVGVSAQTLQADGGIVATGSGESPYEAIWTAFGKARLSGKVKKNWAAMACCLDVDGNLIEPTLVNQQELDVLRNHGMCMLLHVNADGSTHQQ